MEVLRSARFGVEYQPLVCTRSGETLGHEALARFYLPDGTVLATQQVFDCLRGSRFTLYEVERVLKTVQLRQAPVDGLLFLNLDPDAYALATEDGADPLIDVLASRSGVVVEILEHTHLNAARQAERMAEALRARGIGLALDDVGGRDTMLSLNVLLAVQWFKLDRVWLEYARDPRRRAALEHLVAFAHRCDGRVVLEGLESAADLQLAQALGVDAVQGYLFSERFLHVRPAGLQ
jgi:EAL domain-containing protein (putative c-di-GMP-specific phosphodiesterase class I)